MSYSLRFVSLRHYSVHSNLIDLLKTMPKEQKHIAEAQKQRRKIKERSIKYSPGRVTLQVLGTGAKGAPKSLYVFSDQSRYLFNCGEGTQRLAHEHKMKLAKLEHIFITQSTWDNIGGIPGAALTIQDVGVPQIALHGPRGLEELFVATRRFVIIKDLKIDVPDCGEATHFEDNVIKVKYVPLLPSHSPPVPSDSPSSIVEDDPTDYYAHESTSNRTVERKEITSNSQMELQKVKGACLAFICQLQPRPGALSLDKCVTMGVPAGPLLGRIKGGEAITLDNGTVVRPADVCEPDDPGPVFIVVDCPSEDYLDSLVQNEIFAKHQACGPNQDDLAYCIVHFTPPEIIHTDKYKEWLEKFSPSTQHLLLNDSNTCMGSLSVHRIQYKLNLLSEEIFPLLRDGGTEVQQDSSHQITKKPKHNLEVEQHNLEIVTAASQMSVKSRSDITTSAAALSVNSPPTTGPFLGAHTLYNHHLRPRRGADRGAELKLVPSQFVDETMALDGFPEVLHEVRQLYGQRRNHLTIRPYPRLLFLGTGSSIPNKTRNTSGILLEVDETCCILLDCGEGTYGQIVRFYGEASDSVLANLRGIYVSHLHADHHLGLIGVLQGRHKALQQLKLHDESPLILLAPKQITWWLNFYDNCFETIRNQFELVPNSDILPERVYNKLKVEVETCLVRHCPNAFGVSLRNSNWKITYSGDTMPSDNLIKLGQDSDLLIHEATMEDDLAHEAVIKMHSTTSQAIESGLKMGAKYTLLTHFSQRYAKLPRFNDNFSENVGIAFDNMHIKLDELPLLPLLYPALKIMFAEHYEEMEHKAAKRLFKLEREKEAMTVK